MKLDMKLPRATRAVGAAVLVAGSLSLVEPVQAAEYALGDYLLGYTISMSGYTPPPGVYFSDTFYLYSGSASPNVDFPIGRITAAGITYNFIVDVTTVAWFTDVKIFGATLGFAATVPFGSDRNSASVSFVGPLGVNRQLGREDTLVGIGDTAYSATLGWQEGEHHWNVTLTGFAPTGNYNPDKLADMGLHRPAVDLKAAYTFLSPQSGIEASGALGVTVNALNTATNYQSGAELHFE